MGLGDLVSRVIAYPIRGAVEREVKKAAGAEIRKIVADYLGSENFRTGLTGSLSERLDEAVDRLLSNGTLGMEAQQAILAAIQARHPTYEPVLVISSNERKEYQDSGTPLATVNGFGRSRDYLESYNEAIRGIKTDARAMGGKFVVITEQRVYQGFFRTTQMLTGELYANIPQEKNSRTPSYA